MSQDESSLPIVIIGLSQPQQKKERKEMIGKNNQLMLIFSGPLDGVLIRCQKSNESNVGETTTFDEGDSHANDARNH